MQRRETCPTVSYAIQSRLKPSGTRFSVLQATTQSMQPTQRRVSIAMPYRAIAYASASTVTKLTFMPVPPISGSVCTG